MTTATHISIPVPIHPSEMDLPRSIINYQLPSGRVVAFGGLPLQGPKTLQAVIDTLEIWKPNLCGEEPPPGNEFSI
jgi:hypothetical protein